jgi:capsular polysaccharide biosynthesis protein
VDSAYLFRATRRRAPAIAIAAVAAAILTAVLTLATPQQYRGTADVVVPLPPAATSPIAAVSQAVSDFDAALRSEVVAARVAREADLSRGEVSGKVSAEQLAGGTIVEVTYVSDDPATAETVAGSASREAPVFLLEARLAPIAQQRQLAEDDAAAASDAYVGFLQREGIVSPEDFFRDQEGRVRRLNDEAAAAEAGGDIERAELLQARAEDRAADLAPIKDEYETIKATRVQAEARVAPAKDASNVAEAAVDAARDGGGVEVLDAVAIARSSQLARRLLVAVVVATALAIAAVVLMALLGMTGSEPTPATRPAGGDGRRGQPRPRVGQGLVQREDATRRPASAPAADRSEQTRVQPNPTGTRSERDWGR